MAISNKTRKTLWARSGNRCAICRHELVADATHLDSESVVGEECHIRSSNKHGPRFDPAVARTTLDTPSNLILLCRVHHKVVDDQHETFPASKLEKLKSDHEAWVSLVLSEPKPLIPRVHVKRVKNNIPEFLNRLYTSRDIFAVVDGTDAYRFDHDELTSRSEVDLVGRFLQDLQDYGDLSDMFEASDRVKASFELSEHLDQLEQVGFYVFGGREDQVLEGGIGSPEPFPIAIINVLRTTNDGIITAKTEHDPSRSQR